MQTGHLMSQTILIVDGQIAVRQLIQQALQNIGYDTNVADNAEQAVNMIAQHKPHAIIVDDELPNMSGGQLCRQIKGESTTNDIPVIIYSQGLRVTNPDYVKATGADVALRKPVSIEVILKAVQSTLQSIIIL